MHFTRGDIQTAVTLADIKEVGVVEHDESDLQLAMLASAVTAEYCMRTNTALLPETITATYDTWACGTPLRLPIGPLSEANAATLTATMTTATGTITAIEAIDTTTRHGDRPTVTINVSPQGPLAVTYTAGLPAAPHHVRAALAIQVMHMVDDQDIDTQSRRYAPAYASALNTSKRVSI
ncbi:hypothetical protein [Tateyamaria sp. SN3-11]|uniref:hypothetical protein n=1 Tax=Tateyamaria sp. SN3-11 TaxID=3092147 RepID=UPI0039E7A13F